MNPTVQHQLSAPGKGLFLLERLRTWKLSTTPGIVLFFAAHIPLALLMMSFPAVSTAHAALTMLLGLWYGLVNTKPERVAYVVAYVIGAECLWRMTQAMIFWEFGKYALITILLAAIVKSGRLRGPVWAVFYFLLLLPSLVVPMANVSESQFLNQISFNLSGPLALAVSTWFFSGLEFTQTQMKRLFLALIGPVVGIAVITLFDTLSATTIYFTNNSNFITSGGFGPNQVSAILGLGALVAFLLIFDQRSAQGFRLVMVALFLTLGIQCALTFSRGGIYTAGGAAAVATFYLIRQPRARLKVLGGILVLVLVGNFLILPALDSFTEGALTKRFTNTKLTGRDRLIMADFQAWSENPLFGVGPGQAKSYRQSFRANTSAHTEFSRVLAEHGIFGLIATLLLIFSAAQYLIRARAGVEKAFTGAMICWSILYTLTAAMRLAAPAFTFGLAAIRIVPDPEPEPIAARENATHPGSARW